MQKNLRCADNLSKPQENIDDQPDNRNQKVSLIEND